MLFARTPQPGLVMTRLLTHLTPDQACRLHIAATLDTADLLDGALLSGTSIARWIFWSEAPAPNSKQFGLPPSFQCTVQRGEHLGARMMNAFERAFASGAGRVVVVGSDSPHLPPRRIAQAFAALEHHDFALGPAADGGYYLIGCRRLESRLFHDVEWSSPKTFSQTLANAARVKGKVSVLESWYDLDEWKDIRRLMEDASRGLKLPPRLAAFLNQLGRERGEHNPDRDALPCV